MGAPLGVAVAEASGVSDLGLIAAFAVALVALGGVLILAVRLGRRKGEVRVNAAAVFSTPPPPMHPADDTSQEQSPEPEPLEGVSSSGERDPEEQTEDAEDAEDLPRDDADDAEPDADDSGNEDLEISPHLLDDPFDLGDYAPPLPPGAAPEERAEKSPDAGESGQTDALRRPPPTARPVRFATPVPGDQGPPSEHAKLVATAAQLAADGSWTAAAACYREAGDLANAALCYRRAGDLRKVVECLEDIGDYYRVGRILARRGDRVRAEQAFEKVDSGHPKYTKALLLRARLAWEARHADRSADLVRAFLRISTDPVQTREARKLLAKLYEVQHRYGDAMELLLALQEERPSDATVGRRLDRVRARIEDQVRRVDVALMMPEIDVTASGVTIGPTEHDVSTANDHPTGRYDLFELVGQGTLGRVYKGYDNDQSELVAVKFLESWGRSPAIAREAFREAVQQAARVKHRGIAGVREMGELEGHPFVASDYIIGRSLDRRLVQGQPTHPKLLLAVAMQLGAALDHLHDLGLAHGDVKPTNIMLREEPENALVLTDCGLAQALRLVDPSMIGADDADAYRSPEIGGSIGAAADIFSMGVLLYRMLTGALPFSGRPAPSSPPPTPPWFIRREVDQSLGRVVLNCLDPRSDLRPARAGDLAAAVRAAVIRTI